MADSPAPTSADALAALYRETTKANFLSGDEKLALVASRTVFSVSHVEMGNYKGKPRWNLSVTVNGQEKTLSIDSSPIRDKWIQTLQKFVADNGPADMVLVQDTAESGNSFYRILPAALPADETESK